MHQSMNMSIKRVSMGPSTGVDKGTDFDSEGTGPTPSTSGGIANRRMSQMSKGSIYGPAGFNPRYLSRGGSSRHPYSYSLQ